jgi:hypothetical protein
VRYFFDNCLSPAIPEVLRVLRYDAVHIADCAAQGFARGDLDTVWMPKVAALGWVAITSDVAITRRLKERAIPADVGLRLVCLHGDVARMDFFDQAKWVINAWQEIVKHAETAKAGQRYRVTINRKVELMR